MKIFPAQLPLRVVDVQWGYDQATFGQELVRVIKNTVAVQNRNVIVNTSIGAACPVPHARSCMEPEAQNWLELVRGSAAYDDGETGDLETKFLHLTAGGNSEAPNDFDATLDSEYSMARLRTDLYNVS